MDKNAPKHILRYDSPILLLIIVTSAIFLSEIIVMFLIPLLPGISLPISLPAIALIDSLLLIVLLLPILYLSVFRHSRLHILELIKANEQLLTQITERIQAEQKLEVERNKLKGILDTMADGVYIANPHHQIEYVNPSMEKEFGPVSGRKCYEYLHDRTEGCPGCKIFEVFAGKPTRWERYFIKTGKTYDLFDTPIINEDGTISKLAILRDITDRKQAETALRQSEKQLRSLTSQLLTAQEAERRRISGELHDELGQALAVIKLQLSRIGRNLNRDQRPLQEDCKYTLKCVDQVIEDVRRLSRDLSPFILEDLGLPGALRWMADEFTKHHQIQVLLDLPDMDHLLSDQAQIVIYRIFQETLTNIVKHAQATHVSIAIQKEAEMFSFKVEDDGKGFDLRHHEVRSVTEKGLGLTTMKERVRMLGGSLNIWSQEGEGTRITFQIPVEKREKGDREKQSPALPYLEPCLVKRE